MEVVAELSAVFGDKYRSASGDDDIVVEVSRTEFRIWAGEQVVCDFAVDAIGHIDLDEMQTIIDAIEAYSNQVGLTADCRIPVHLLVYLQT